MNWQSLRFKLRFRCLLITCMGCWCIQPSVQPFPVKEPPSLAGKGNPESVQKLRVAQLKQRARVITVKVLSGYGSGSGILIKKQGQTYTVLTNDHVLAAGESHRIQTPDGKIYRAQFPKKQSFDGNDLALLQFISASQYTVARLASSPVTVGEEVFAAGFPGQDISEKREFTFLLGNVAFVCPKALAGGYQIGYSNPVEKGMSGGPLLNYQGEVVGINGMHAYPLWGDPYVFKDGSKPDLPRDLMLQSSWAIPIETFTQLNRKSTSSDTCSPTVRNETKPLGDYREDNHRGIAPTSPPPIPPEWLW